MTEESIISRKNKSRMIKFASHHNTFYLQDLDSCNKITKNHVSRKTYAEELVNEGIFWTDSVKPAGKESSRYVLLRENHLLDHPKALLYVLADQLGIKLSSNNYFLGKLGTLFPNSTDKLKRLTFKRLKECGDHYKIGLDQSSLHLQLFRKCFILFLIVKEIDGMENKMIQSEEDVLRYSEKLQISYWKRCHFIDDFIKYVEDYQTGIPSHDRDFKTLARVLDEMYESLIYYYEFLSYHKSTLKDRIKVMSMLCYDLKGKVAKKLGYSSKQVTNIIRPIISGEKPDPKKIADIQKKENGHIFIEQVKQEEIDDLFKNWDVKTCN